jgi:hypothetical protein
MTQKLKLFKPARTPKPQPARDVVTRWGGDPRIRSEGFVTVPVRFLMYHAALKPYRLEAVEAFFIVHLMAYKWDDAAPFPSMTTIARRMGVSVNYARTIARNLEGKGFLSRIQRVGTSNAFDLTPLFTKLADHVTKAAKPTARSSRPRKQTPKSKARTT